MDYGRIGRQTVAIAALRISTGDLFLVLHLPRTDVCLVKGLRLQGAGRLLPDGQLLLGPCDQ